MTTCEASTSGAGEDLAVDSLLFPDGGRYSGTLKHGIADGIGTCVWPNGNTYSGEWRGSQMHGFGTYVWASGQRYDGEWKDGRRNGIGVKLYADGSTFDGFWRDERKHGVGVYRPATRKPPSSGSATTSSPPRGRPPPRDGSAPASPPCRGGAAASVGALTPLTGDSHQDLSDLRPSPVRPQRALSIPANPTRREGRGEPAAAAAVATVAAATPARAAVAAAASLLAAESVAHPHMRPVHPATVDGQSEILEDPLSSVDDRDVVLIRAFDNGVLVREDALTAAEIKRIFGPLWVSRPSRVRTRVKMAFGIGRKLKESHGELLFKGMAGFDLMMQLQLGVRYSLGRMDQSRPDVRGAKLQRADFLEKRKVFFPGTGSHTTPAHPSSDFKWKDYAPRVFHALRTVYGVSDAEYMLALGGSQALYQLNSPGKSGCLFFLTEDQRFIVKTLRKSEIGTLIDMLPALHAHAASAPQQCLLTRFYGVHAVKRVHGRIVRFVVMQNLFNSDLRIHRKFDLKGSTFERTAGKVDPQDASSVFKDLDLDLLLRLPPDKLAALSTQLKRDAAFLEAAGVMDYSLLLGIHYCARGSMHPPPAADGASPDASPASVPFPLLPGKGSMGHTGASWPAGPSGNSTAAGASPLPATRQAARPTSLDAHHLPPHSGSDTAPSTPPNGSGFGSPFLPQALTGWHGAGGPSSLAATPPDTPPHVMVALVGNGQGTTTQAGVATQPLMAAVVMDGSSGALPQTLRAHSEMGYSAARRHARLSGDGDGSGTALDPLDAPGGSGVALTAERLRNFDVFTANRDDARRKLGLVEQRMRGAGYSEQRIADVLGLVKLKVLGDRFQRASLSKRGRTPTLVLQALNQIRLTNVGDGDGPEDGGSLDGDADGSVHDGSVREGSVREGSLRSASLGPRDHEEQMGFNMHAIAVPKARSGQAAASVASGGEEVIITFAIIDILQEYNVRKLFERGFKSLMHDPEAISVAPPDKYAQRFINFMLNETFFDPSKHVHLSRDVAHQSITEEPDDEAAAAAAAAAAGARAKRRGS